MKYIILLLALFPYTGFSMAVSQDINGFKVYLTQIKQEADLIVYIDPKFRSLKKEDTWTFVKESPEFLVHFVKDKEESQLVVLFTNNKNESGWIKPHPLIGNLTKF